MKLSFSSLFVTCTVLLMSASAFSDTIEQVQQNQTIQQQERERLLRQQQLPNREVQLPSSFTAPEFNVSDSTNDDVCFPINHIELIGEEHQRFQFALKTALKEIGFMRGQCLNASDINRLMSNIQNQIIGRGYTTTRILAAPQNLQLGKLELTVFPGYVHSYQVNQTQSAQTHAGRIASFQNEFPSRSSKLLNLRDLEQGLENLKRLPTVEADIQIIPATQPNESVVAIQWQQRTVPYRLSFGFDNSGSQSTGKYQGNVTLSADNPFGLSDMAYFSVGRALGNIPDEADDTGRKVNGRSHNYHFHYSVPFGKWLWEMNHSRYRYHQAVMGYQEVYDYNGQSWNSDFGFNRLMYRNAQHKIHLGAKLWQRQTRSYIDDAEIGVQRRKTAGWSVQIGHKAYWKSATSDVKLSYKRGTGLNQALTAPEELFGEAVSRVKLLTANINVNIPFNIQKQRFNYDTTFNAQWHRKPLTAQDRMSIGGRYSVRGFDGEMNLSAERGFYWRNELGWSYRPTHQVYVAADLGKVYGPSAGNLLGQKLAGGAIGLRGQLKAGGNLSYDISVSKPLSKPQFFNTKNRVIGFNLNYAF